MVKSVTFIFIYQKHLEVTGNSKCIVQLIILNILNNTPYLACLVFIVYAKKNKLKKNHEYIYFVLNKIKYLKLILNIGYTNYSTTLGELLLAAASEQMLS